MIGLPERAELDQLANPYAALAANAFASPAGDNSGLLARILGDPRMQHHAAGLLSCLQCGICTSGCPAARFGDFSPREISRRALLGDPTLLEDDLVWLCCYCYTCQSRCPRGNSVAVINQIIRGLQVELGVRAQARGAVHRVDGAVLRDRSGRVAAPASRRHRRRLG